MSTEHVSHMMTDCQLVVLAQKGERAAYNELVLRYREQVLKWATTIAMDRHLAEDAAQEALMQAYLQLHTLRQPERFAPWLRRIVRNYAYMLVRRGGPYAKEMPFAAYREQAGSGEREGGASLDYALNKLARTALQARSDLDSPLEAALRGETSDGMRKLLLSLNPKERSVFEAHVLQQFSPQEIAAMMSTTPANVYTTLSRSRRKLQELYYHANLTRYLKDRLLNGTEAPRMELGLYGIYFGEIWDSFALCVLYAAQYTDKSSYTLVDIMGFTGLAFRLQMDRQKMSYTGTNAFHWPTVYGRGLEGMGFSVKSFGDGAKVNQASEKLIEACAFVQHEIDCGRPVIVWGIKLRHFGFIYGYNDKSRTFRMVGLFEETMVAYEELGQGYSSELFIVSIGEAREVAAREALAGALQTIIAHGEGDEPRGIAGCSYGLEAYDVWMNQLKQGDAGAYDNAYMLWTTASNRQFACQFLAGIAGEAERYGADAESIAQAARRAAASFGEVYETLLQLKGVFPFPRGGKPDDPEVQAAAVALLRQARSCEAGGLAALKELLQLLQ